MLGTSLRVRGKLTLRNKEFIFFYFYIYSFDDILCRILRYESYVFFLPSTFRFYPPLKNDGTSELLFRKAVSDFSPNKRKNTNCKPLKGASVRINEKPFFYKTVVNTCLSFLNRRKKRSGIEQPKSTGVSDGKQTVFQGTTRCCKVNEQTHENRK